MRTTIRIGTAALGLLLGIGLGSKTIDMIEDQRSYYRGYAQGFQRGMLLRELMESQFQSKIWPSKKWKVNASGGIEKSLHIW